MTMSEAWEPWLPTLQDIEKRKSDDPYGPYSSVGWDALEVPDEAVHVKARMPKLKQLFDELKATYFADEPSFFQLSEGMTDDYPIAIEEGSTIVRIGSMIFGSRGY